MDKTTRSKLIFAIADIANAIAMMHQLGASKEEILEGLEEHSDDKELPKILYKIVDLACELPIEKDPIGKIAIVSAFTKTVIEALSATPTMQVNLN